MPLTETAVKNAKPKEKDYKLSDEKSMHLMVTKAGGKLWRLAYRFDGKQKLLALGKWPEIPLKQARERRDDARKQLANGIDPSEARKAEKTAEQEQQANTFGRVAEEWFEIWREGKAPATIEQTRYRLDRFILPTLADLPVADVGASDILPILEAIQRKGTLSTMRRTKMNVSQVLSHAIGTGRREKADPCLYFKSVLKTSQTRHHPAFTKPEDVARLLKAIDSRAHDRQASVFVSAALKLLPLLFCRPGELVAMRWTDVDLDRAEWRYTTSKTGIEHHVPLAQQAVKILHALRGEYGADGFVFPGLGRHGGHVNKVALNRALQDLGIDTRNEHTSHGFRAMARTLLAERLRFAPQVIEHQLSHRVADALGTAYNRTLFLDERKEMMQAWADYLDYLKTDYLELRATKG